MNGAESGSQRYATIRRGSHGNVPAGGNEDMFVFQTQSASTASRVIDHRAKEVARREGHTHKSTREGGGAENMYIVCLYMYMYMYIHVLMKDEKEGRKKQARSNKQQGKATQHTQGSHFSLEK